MIYIYIYIYWFKYSIAISLYHRELGSNPERINKRLEEFTSRFNWKNIDFPASINDYNVFEKK